MSYTFAMIDNTKMIFTYFCEINWYGTIFIPFLQRHLIYLKLTNQPNVSFFMQAGANFIKLNSQHGLNNNWAVTSRWKSIFIHFFKKNKKRIVSVKWDFQLIELISFIQKKDTSAQKMQLSTSLLVYAFIFIFFSKFKYEQFAIIRGK